VVGDWLKRYLGLDCGVPEKESRTLYAFPLGPLEIVLIVAAVVLVFGISRLSRVGGALGKSVREFHREKEGGKGIPLLTSGSSWEETGKRSEDNSNAS